MSWEDNKISSATTADEKRPLLQAGSATTTDGAVGAGFIRGRKPARCLQVKRNRRDVSTFLPGKLFLVGIFL
ncbi:unnamed protein product [Orchesella dallaii]|uniref:Uncharacterized protein n=1 Tax=Orchesella dallaii TaxID=48710 RepID=A0ABP1RM31_9HEXA